MKPTLTRPRWKALKKLEAIEEIYRSALGML